MKSSAISTLILNCSRRPHEKKAKEKDRMEAVADKETATGALPRSQGST